MLPIIIERIPWIQKHQFTKIHLKNVIPYIKIINKGYMVEYEVPTKR